MRPFIMIAPTGARRSKADHRALPITIPEILAEARACAALGADALHLHVRDADAKHSLDHGLYTEALESLHEDLPTLRIQVTTESAGRYDVSEQTACLETLAPDWASVSIREIARAPQRASRIYHGCAERGTEIQHILYDQNDLAQLLTWKRDGTIPDEKTGVIFVLGSYIEPRDAIPTDLDPFLDNAEIDMDWMVCAFGPNEHLCLEYAARRGAALRVGFENSLTLPDGTPHISNADSLTKLIHRLEGGTS